MQEYRERSEKVEKRGGTRKGAGRPSIGIKKMVTITLEADEWAEIDALIAVGEFKGYTDYFRSQHRANKEAH
ncbi:transcriptional regulator [Paenibacillus oralis]|uniref:Transcriptional regulator n=1 Tax=Paenibacillus oralis TaxID=2490856 RepID=A0A3P3TCE0_9BACL|nr:transcriptional regulator [Paenibacillus oralis]RRJ54758.1 transcriptional regulator [Paenibacillus oralis]